MGYFSWQAARHVFSAAFLKTTCNDSVVLGTEERLDATELGTLVIDLTASRFMIEVPAPAILLTGFPLTGGC